ncbi:hypothetical protein AB833_02005 [Chromatiales bacterium (ex Bugula neritina AB1)]|nr:hypothetical protein AB833_02005 [Chromatiales bacterium (ex Bugula neritina AB1)]
MKTAFVSYRFSEEIEPIALMIKNWFKVHELMVIDGKQLDATNSLNEQLKNRISNADILVSIRADETTSIYVAEEAAFAAGKGKPIIIVSKGAYSEGSLLNDQFYIDLDRGFDAANDLSNAVVKILEKGYLDLNAKKVKHPPKDEVDAEGWSLEIREKIRVVRVLMDEREIDKALESAMTLLNDHPECWRAGIAISACLIIKQDYKQAEQILNDVIDNFSGSGRAVSYAYQNMAWLYFEKHKEVDSEINQKLIGFYRDSIEAYPRIDIFFDLIMTYLDADLVGEADKVIVEALQEFPEIEQKVSEMVSSEGSSFVQLVTKSNLLSAIAFPKEPRGDK